MKLLLTALMAVSALAQTVTVTGTLYSPWSPSVTWSGRVEITANCSMTYAGKSYERGSTLTVVAINGALTVRLIPNLAASVSGCYNNENVYVVNFNPSSGGQRYTQKWAVAATPTTTTPQAVVVPSVINGVGGGVPYSQSFTSATSVTITAASHRLGTTPVVVTVYDSNGFETDANVSWNSTNGTVTVTFAIATTGRVVVMAAGGVGGWGGAYTFQSPLENLNNQISVNQSLLSLAWSQITSKPTFATVATSGAYNDLTGKPTLGTAAAQNVEAFEVPLTFGSGLTRTTNSVAITSIPAWAAMPGGLAAGDWADYIDALVSGLPIANGGTGATSAASALTNLGGIAASVLTTNGALLTRAGGVPAQLGLGGACSLLYAGASAPLYTSTSGLCWDAANGRLGIGTASPTAALTIVGGAIQLGADGSSVQMYVPNGGAWRTGALGSFSYFDLGNVVVRNGNGSTSGASLRVAGGISIGSGYTGTAPPTDGAIISGSVGIGPGNTSPSGTLNCSDRTPTTGSTACNFQAGPGQSGNVLRVLNNAGTEVWGVASNGDIIAGGRLKLTTFADSVQRIDIKYTATGAGIVSFGAVQGNDLAFITNDSLTRLYVVASTGAVGVATTSPSISGTGKFHAAGNTARPFDTARTPATAAEACNAGELSFDASYVYVCTASATWKRAAISTW